MAVVHSPAEVMAAYLIQLGVGSDPETDPQTAWPCYYDSMPDGDDVPDEVMCVYDAPGKQDGRIQRGGETIEHPGIQVMVRSKSKATGWTQANLVKDALDGANQINVTLPDTTARLLESCKRGNILPLGQEKGHQRFKHSINATLTLPSGTSPLVVAPSGGLIPSEFARIYTFVQNSPATVWNINHGLAQFPSVTVVDSAGTEVEGDVQYIDDDNIQVTFTAAFSGTAYLN